MVSTEGALLPDEMLIIEHWHKKSSPSPNTFSSLAAAGEERPRQLLTHLNYNFLKRLGYNVNQLYNPRRHHHVKRT